MSATRPEKTFRIGDVYADVWLNETEDDRSFHNVTLHRRYQDGNGNWQSTNSFPLTRLLNAGYVLQQATDFVAAQEAKGSSS